MNLWTWVTTKETLSWLGGFIIFALMVFLAIGIDGGERR